MRGGSSCFGAAVAIAIAGCAQPAPAGFLLYVIDTLRADALGCYGGPASPNVDALAAEATLYENAWASSSWTRPSMASLFSGLSAREHGVEGRGGVLSAELASLPARLREAGYRTAFITSNPNAGGAFGFGHGFDELIELYTRREPGRVQAGEFMAGSAQVASRAIRWLESAPEPFFLAVLDVGPHHPFTPPGISAELSAELDRLRRELAGGSGDADALAPRVRALSRQLYQGEVAAMDAAFGRVIDSLRASGRLDRTLVVFTADHGEEFLDHGGVGHGHSLHEELVHVPLIVRAPAAAPKPERVATPVSLVDLPAEALGLLRVADAAGRALARGAAVMSHLCVDGRNQASLREGDHKLVVDLTRRTSAVYDLAADPGEQHPIEDPALHRSLQGRLRALSGPGALRARPCDERVGEIPEDVREALEALGYGN
jgi:arylsulfatase A-like enzyme